jgi:hypothetical protein
MGQIDIDVDKNGKPDCAQHKEKEGKRVHWRCLDSSVTAWEVWFNKNGCPFDSTIFTDKGAHGRNALPDTARQKSYNYRVTVTTHLGTKHKDPPLDIP